MPVDVAVETELVVGPGSTGRGTHPFSSATFSRFHSFFHSPPSADPYASSASRRHKSRPRFCSHHLSASGEEKCARRAFAGESGVSEDGRDGRTRAVEEIEAEVLGESAWSAAYCARSSRKRVTTWNSSAEA